jgi:hypothetical protein
MSGAERIGQNAARVVLTLGLLYFVGQWIRWAL